MPSDAPSSAEDRPKIRTFTTFSGPTCKAGQFEMTVSGPLNSKTLNNVIKQLEIYKSMLDEDEADTPPTDESN